MDQRYLNSPAFNEANNEEEAINLKELVVSAYIHWKWILASLLIFLVAGFVYTKYQSEVYESSSQILILDDKNSSNALEKIALIDGLGSDNIDDEVELIQSHPIALEVVDSLDLNISYSTKNKVGRVIDLYKDAPIEVLLPNDVPEGTGFGMTCEKLSSGDIRVKWEDVVKSNDETKAAGVERTVDLKSLPAVLNLPIGKVVIQSRVGGRDLNEPVSVFITDKKAAIGAVLGSLKASAIKDGNVVNLTVRSGNPQKCIDILTQLMAAYNRDAISQVNQSSMNSRNFIDERLKFLTTELSDVEKDVEGYKKSNNLTDISAEAELYLEKGSEYNMKGVEVETQINLVRFVEDFISKENNRYALIPNLGLNDAGLVAVIGAYNQLLMNRERIKQGSNIDNPALRTINEQIASARRAIFTGISNVKSALGISRSDIRKQDNLMLSRIKEIPRQEREFIEIKRQQKIKETLYIFLLQKREEASLNIAITVPKARVTREAAAANKVAPKSSLILIIAFFLGLFFPVLVLFILSKINTKVTLLQDIEKISSLPVIAELSRNDNPENPLLPHEKATNTHAERFRLLRTRLQLALDFPTQKVVLVSSTRPGEGKTFVSANISLSLATAEKKVILIGLDLRKPQLTKLFKLNDKKEGVSSFLSGQTTDYHALIQKTDNPFLHIMPAGVIPPNPNELLMKERLDILIEKLKAEYDYVILDSAPVGAVSDTILIGRVADVTLYICRSSYSEKSDIEFVNKISSQKIFKSIYLVLNDVDLSNRIYYYNQKSGYNYNYGYRHNKSKDKVDGFDGLS